MAYRTVNAGEMPVGGNYQKFESIGQQIAGIFLSVEEVINNFGKKQNNYTFKTRDGDITISAPAHLDFVLKFAKLKKGDKVIMKCIGEKSTGKEKPMKLFEVKVEDGVAPAEAVALQAPKPAKAPEADLDDLFP